MSEPSLLHQIQNSIKDIVITKLLDRVISQDKEIAKCKEENDHLKFSLLIVLKQKVIEKTQFPLSLCKKQKSTGLSFLSPNASRSGINKLNLSKITLTQYSSNETIDNKEAKLDNRVSTLYKRNKAELTLSPSYHRPSLDHDQSIKEIKAPLLITHINVKTKTNLMLKQQPKAKSKPKEEVTMKKLSAHSSAKTLSKLAQYKTSCCVHSTPNKMKFNSSMVLHNKSSLGTAVATDPIKKDKNILLMKIQKKIISKVRSLNQKR